LTSDEFHPERERSPRQRIAVLTAIYLACFALFLVDIVTDVPIAAGVLYAPLVWAATLHRDRRLLWPLTVLAVTMTVIGFFVPHIGPELWVALINRILSIIAILVTALFIQAQRDAHDRLAEQTRRAAAANRAKTALLRHVSHEIRRPLEAIFAETAALGAGGEEPPPGLARIDAAAGKLLHTFDDLIDLAAADGKEIEIEPVDLAALLGEAIDDALATATSRGIGLLWLPPGNELPPARGNGWAVRRIAGNLLANALRFTPPGGAVTVRMEQRGNLLAAEFADTGSGIASEQLERLGQPFFQAQEQPEPEGLGLGLAACLRLANAMGASLSVASEPGRGTVFTVLFALA
jgi:cell cycle sensor histidine kinase DivJ